MAQNTINVGQHVSLVFESHAIRAIFNCTEVVRLWPQHPTLSRSERRGSPAQDSTFQDCRNGAPPTPLPVCGLCPPCPRPRPRPIKIPRSFPSSVRQRLTNPTPPPGRKSSHSRTHAARLRIHSACTVARRHRQRYGRGLTSPRPAPSASQGSQMSPCRRQGCTWRAPPSLRDSPCSHRRQRARPRGAAPQCAA